MVERVGGLTMVVRAEVDAFIPRKGQKFLEDRATVDEQKLPMSKQAFYRHGIVLSVRCS